MTDYKFKIKNIQKDIHETILDFFNFSQKNFITYFDCEDMELFLKQKIEEFDTIIDDRYKKLSKNSLENFNQKKSEIGFENSYEETRSLVKKFLKTEKIIQHEIQKEMDDFCEFIDRYYDVLDNIYQKLRG